MSAELKPCEPCAARGETAMCPFCYAEAYCEAGGPKKLRFLDEGRDPLPKPACWAYIHGEPHPFYSKEQMLALAALAAPSQPADSNEDAAQVRARISREIFGELSYEGKARLASWMADLSKPAEPECKDCQDTGQMCVGTSGSEEDGNAPVFERCPSCGYGESQPAEPVAQAGQQPTCYIARDQLAWLKGRPQDDSNACVRYANGFPNWVPQHVREEYLPLYTHPAAEQAAADPLPMFETWAKAQGMNTARRNDPNSPDTFFAYETEQRWLTWKACIELAARRPVRELSDDEIVAIAAEQKLPVITRAGEYPWAYIEHMKRFARALLSKATEPQP